MAKSGDYSGPPGGPPDSGSSMLRANLLQPPDFLFVDSLPKVCVVCNDKAQSCNFGAISCESCKAFFRRNAHKEGKMKSKCSGSCEVTLEKRSKCKKCRLEKCFLRGMKKDMILSVEQKQERKRKILINKMRKTVSQPSHQDDTKSVPNYQPDPTDDMKEEEDDDEDLLDDQSLMPSEPKLHKDEGNGAKLNEEINSKWNLKYTKTEGFHIKADAEAGPSSVEDHKDSPVSGSSKDETSSASEKGPKSKDSEIASNSYKAKEIKTKDWFLTGVNIKTPQTGRQKLDSSGQEDTAGSCIQDSSSPSSASIFSKSNSTSPTPLHSSGWFTNFTPAFEPHLYSESLKEERLNKLDVHSQHIMRDLMGAFTSFDQPLRESSFGSPSMTETFNHCEIAIEILVKMAKNLPSFAMFNQDDQILLLKGSVIDLLLLQAMRAFDDVNMCFVTPKCNLKGGKQLNSDGEKHLLSVYELGNEGPYVPLIKKYVEAFQIFKAASKGQLSILMCCLVIFLFTPRKEFDYCNKTHAAYWLQTYTNVLRAVINKAYVDLNVDLNDVLNAMEVIKGVSHIFKETLSKCSPFDLNPLIVEIFDISA